MNSWLQRLKEEGGAEVARRKRPAHPPPRKTDPPNAPHRDPNIPRKRYQIHQKCLYERTLPGNAYVSAHVNRLQHGYYESSKLHEPVVDNLYFVSVHFVFHPQDPRSHRFKSAEISVCVHGDDDYLSSHDDLRHHPPTSHPKILKHAPELMFGAVSPENLQWNFSLSSSLGVSQTPLSATLNPSGGVNGSYKVFHMMSIQGSVRSRRSPFGPEYDIEDAMAVWTLEENMLQRSGLPREFDFVLLVHKPDDVKNVYLTVDVDAEIDAWYGAYPKWYTNFSKFKPNQDFHLDFNSDIGQRFFPTDSARGFNFASLPHPMDEYVTMPGTVYPTNDVKTDDDNDGERPDPKKPFTYALLDSDDKAIEAAPPTSPKPQKPSPTRAPNPSAHQSPTHQQPAPQSQHRQSWHPPSDLNVRVVLEHTYPSSPSHRRPPHTPSHSRSPDARRYSYSPISGGAYDPQRYPSIRRRKSRSGLKEYGAKQALHELAQNELEGGSEGEAGREGRGLGVGREREERRERVNGVL